MIINSPKNGKIGKDGITPHIGDNGNWYLGTEDTGVAAKAQGNTDIVEITLPASDWDESLTQTVACIGISENEAEQMVTLLPSLSSNDVYAKCRISCTAFAMNSLTFTAEILPEKDVTVFVAMESEASSVANNVYSTEETVVGTWYNGKPVYRRTFIGTSGANGTIIDLVEDGDCDEIINQYGYYNADDTNPVPFPYFGVADSKGIYLRFQKSSNNNIAIRTIGTALAKKTFTATVEYTRLSDTATIDIPSATALMDAYEEGVNEA